jgi:hypothetical protein
MKVVTIQQILFGIFPLTFIEIFAMKLLVEFLRKLLGNFAMKSLLVIQLLVPI